MIKCFKSLLAQSLLVCVNSAGIISRQLLCFIRPKKIAKELCSNCLWPKIGQFCQSCFTKYVYKSSLVLEKYVIQV